MITKTIKYVIITKEQKELVRYLQVECPITLEKIRDAVYSDAINFMKGEDKWSFKWSFEEDDKWIHQ